MIRNLSKLFLALCLLTVGGGIVANAQIDTGTTIQANVPFTFMVGDTTLPAGKYEIKGLDDSGSGVLELSSVKGNTKVVFDSDNAEANPERLQSKSELVFNKVGDKYFLSQVWPEDSASGSQLVRSRMEKKLEAGGMKPERHSITAILKRLKR
jgi:hypothetical protein